MTENISIEMVNEPRRRSFFHTRAGIILLICLMLVILAGVFSWWTAKGRISSVSARLDTFIYTVEPQYPSRLEKILVHPGAIVAAGQPLAKISTQTAPMQPQSQHYVGTTPFASNESISDRLRKAQQVEQEMAARVNQARAQEERLKIVLQELVTEHVRTQLAMRSIDRRNAGAYEQAAAAEANAKSRMDQARNEFEQYSRMRAAQDTELKKIRSELQRFKKMNNITDSSPAANLPPTFTLDSDIFSPVAGKILRILSQPGQTVTPAQPLFVIQPADKKNDQWIEAWFPLDATGKIKPGQKVNIHIENKDVALTGRVLSIADEAQTLPDSGNEAVNINSLNSEDRQKFNALRYLAVKIGFDAPESAGMMEPGTKVYCQIQTRNLFSFLE